MDKILAAAREAGRAFAATVPACPNRGDHIAQVAWSYAARQRGHNINRRAIAEAFIAAAI